MVLIGYESNVNRMRLLKRVECMACSHDNKRLHQRLLPTLRHFSDLER